SGVGIRIERAEVPIDATARRWFELRGADPIVEALGGGDDYELVFTAAPRLAGRLRTVARHAGTAITRIGICTKGSTVELVGDGSGTAISAPLPDGFGHFR